MFHCSGLSLMQFCQLHGLAKSTVHQWLKTDTNKSAPSLASADKPMTFARVITTAAHDKHQSPLLEQDASPVASDGTAITLALPNGMKMHLPHNYDLRLLIKLVKGLAAC